MQTGRRRITLQAAILRHIRSGMRMVTAAALEAISPPAAIAWMVLNRVVHAAK
jgi:hypothetical protein